MEEERATTSYEQTFKYFSDKVERLLLRLTIIFVILLLCTQGLLQIPMIRKAISRVDVLEGKPYYGHKQITSERE
jgi:hypothetical protein